MTVAAIGRSVEADSEGLPVGVQVVARHRREDIVLAVMSALETHFRAEADYPEALRKDERQHRDGGGGDERAAVDASRLVARLLD